MKFVDAQEMAILHPDTFEVPTLSDLDDITEGSIVKVCDGIERFWVIVDNVVGDRIKGFVDNELIKSELKLGDTIFFEKKNIYSIYYE